MVWFFQFSRQQRGFNIVQAYHSSLVRLTGHGQYYRRLGGPIMGHCPDWGGFMSNEHIDSEFEEIEGIGSAEDEVLGDYPLDTMMIRNESRTIHDVLRRISQEQFIMDPDFQRQFIWSPAEQSKLIESVLMRIPLPVFYIAENEDGTMVVVDGLQRLSTFMNFVSGGLRLRLPHQSQLDGKLFTELENKFQNRIEDCNLTLYVIDSNAPERARLDIFERVNSGVPLTRQQMRNSLYMGHGTRFLRDEASKPLFLEATGRTLNWRQMRDREFINRFCGFELLALEDYRGDMDLFLAQTLSEMNKLDSAALGNLSGLLSNGLKNNMELFGQYAFRKHTMEREGRRAPINASLWDVMCTGLARYGADAVKSKESALQAAFYSLLEDKEFDDAISLGTNQTNKVKLRFEMANEMFQEVLGAEST